MNRTPVRRMLLVALFAALALPLIAHAQEPRSSLGRIEEWVCAKADEAGDSYRAPFCSPRCDCLQPSSLASVTSCSETAAGSFEATQGDTTGTCGEVCVPSPTVQGVSTCPGSSSHDSCITSCSDPGEQCLIGVGKCERVCFDDSECTGSAVNCENTPASECEPSNEFDCPPGSTCSLFNNGITYCDPVTCTQDSDCDLQYVKLELTGVSTAADVAPVACSEQLNLLTPTSATISSNDALECIAQIEAAIGQSCTPFVP